MEVGKVVALWYLELLPGLVTLFLATFRTKEDGRNRQHGDNDLQGRGEREGGESRHYIEQTEINEDAPLVIY